jgi:hypothetical protein
MCYVPRLQAAMDTLGGAVSVVQLWRSLLFVASQTFLPSMLGRHLSSTPTHLLRPGGHSSLSSVLL